MKLQISHVSKHVKKFTGFLKGQKHVKKIHRFPQRTKTCEKFTGFLKGQKHVKKIHRFPQRTKTCEKSSQVFRSISTVKIHMFL